MLYHKLGVIVVFLLGILSQSRCWIQQGDFEDLFSLFRPKGKFLTKNSEEQIKNNNGDKMGAFETHLPFPINISPHNLNRQSKDTKESPKNETDIFVDMAGSMDGQDSKQPKEKNIDIFVDMIGSMDGPPFTVVGKNKPKEKVLMSVSDMFIPFQSMKPLNTPDFFNNKGELSRSLNEFFPFLMPIFSLSNRHKIIEPIKRHKNVQKKRNEPQNSFTLKSSDPFETMFDFITQQFKNFTASSDFEDSNIIQEELFPKIIHRSVYDMNYENCTKSHIISTTVNQIGISGPKEIKVDTKSRDSRFKYFSRYNLGYLMIAAPIILTGLLSAIIGIETVRRNRDIVCKNCPFSHYSQIEQC